MNLENRQTQLQAGQEELQQNLNNINGSISELKKQKKATKRKIDYQTGAMTLLEILVQDEKAALEDEEARVEKS